MPALSNSQSIRTKIRLAHGRLDAVADRFWSHPGVRDLYPEFLFLVHSMIRTSVRMMEEAAAAAREIGDADPVAPQLAAYFETHSREEAGHDDWLLDDLEVLGVERAAVWARLPSTIVAGLIGAQYYWIRHLHPVALLGFLAVLEGNPPKVEELEAIRRRTGHPAEAFRTLIKHAEIDPHHRDDLNELIDALPLEPRHHTLIAISAFHTIEQVSLAFEEVLAAQRD